jgi:hypothetical protein
LLIMFNTIIERLNIDLETEVFLRVLWMDENKKYIVVVNINDHRKKRPTRSFWIMLIC